MVAKVQIKRTSTLNSPPADMSLAPGELAIEMDTPTRLWVGVTPAIEPVTGRKLLFDSSAVPPPIPPIPPDELVDDVPQGRLTLDPAAPVMTTSVLAATALRYVGYRGLQVPIFDGTLWTMHSIGAAGLTANLADATNGPGAVGNDQNHDWFVWDSGGGTLKLTHGANWTIATNRPAGALATVGGVRVNGTVIANGPAVQRGTYVGTTRSNAAGRLDWIFGGPDTAGFFGVWNAYNRVNVACMGYDNTASWTYGGTAWRPWRNRGANNRVSAIFGLNDDTVDVSAMITTTSVPSAGPYMGISIDSITAAPVGAFGNFGGEAGMVEMLVARHLSTQLGFHYWTAMENTDGPPNTFTFYGSTPGYGRCGLFFSARM